MFSILSTTFFCAFAAFPVAVREQKCGAARFFLFSEFHTCALWTLVGSLAFVQQECLAPRAFLSCRVHCSCAVPDTDWSLIATSLQLGMEHNLYGIAKHPVFFVYRGC